MSTYRQESLHPLTGKWEEATWHDDFFGRHEYGVEFPDGSYWKANKIKTRHCETCACEITNE